MLIVRLFISCLLLSISSLNLHAQEQMPGQLMRNVQASLVQIRVVDSKTFNNNGHAVVGTFTAQGSGIIIGSDGLILTNTHIIADAGQILVGLNDGSVLQAKVVYSSNADFSFIKINPSSPLTTINWADSSQAPVGTPIIALTTGDDSQTHILGGAITNLTTGIDNNNVELIELNLNLIPGDSGGPLLDSEGRLLGMIMARKNNESNKTYAIASNKIQQEYMQYQQHLL